MCIYASRSVLVLVTLQLLYPLVERRGDAQLGFHRFGFRQSFLVVFVHHVSLTKFVYAAFFFWKASQHAFLTSASCASVSVDSTT